MRCESGNGPVLSSRFWYQLLSEEMIKVVESSGFDLRQVGPNVLLVVFLFGYGCVQFHIHSICDQMRRLVIQILGLV